MIEQLFRIRILHGYFSDGVYQQCSVVPDGDTVKIVDRYDLISRMIDGSYGLYTSGGGDPAALVRYLNDQLDGEPLRFLVTADAAQFALITTLPLDWVGQVELSTRAVKVDGSTIQLIPTLVPRMVDKQNVIGVISVYLEDLMNCSNVQYTVNFQARSLRWLYYLINRSQTKLYSPVIRGESLVFDGPEPIVLPNGESGLCFTSGEMKFPLQQIPTLMFDLIDRLPASVHEEGGLVDYCLIQGLPTPSAGDLNRAETGRDVVSAMYVYL